LAYRALALIVVSPNPLHDPGPGIRCLSGGLAQSLLHKKYSDRERKLTKATKTDNKVGTLEKPVNVPSPAGLPRVARDLCRIVLHAFSKFAALTPTLGADTLLEKGPANDSRSRPG
jgi:hypothetical protein